LHLEVVNPIEIPEWDALILSHPESSIFHSSAWARVLVGTYGFTPQYFVGAESGRIVAAIPMMEIKNLLSGPRGVSLPFADQCDLILPEGTGLEDIVEHLAEYGKQRGWKAIEFRVRREIPDGVFPYQHYFHHLLELSGNEPGVVPKFRKNIRRNVQKAEREGIKVDISTTLEALEKYYRLHCMTRRDHGLPPPPASFFRNIHRHVVSVGNGIVVLAYHGGRVIAGGVYLGWGDKAYFKYGASDRKYGPFRANQLVMREAIRWYSERGFRNFSFGRTDVENHGLRAYKLGWGTREDTIKKVRYHIRDKRYVSGKNRVYGWHNAVFRKLPIGVSRLIGRALYKFMD